jgi:hypothetical protein
MTRPPVKETLDRIDGDFNVSSAREIGSSI